MQLVPFRGMPLAPALAYGSGSLAASAGSAGDLARSLDTERLAERLADRERCLEADRSLDLEADRSLDLEAERSLDLEAERSLDLERSLEAERLLEPLLLLERESERLELRRFRPRSRSSSLSSSRSRLGGGGASCAKRQEAPRVQRPLTNSRHA